LDRASKLASTRFRSNHCFQSAGTHPIDPAAPCLCSTRARIFFSPASRSHALDSSGLQLVSARVQPSTVPRSASLHCTQHLQPRVDPTTGASNFSLPPSQRTPTSALPPARLHRAPARLRPPARAAASSSQAAQHASKPASGARLRLGQARPGPALFRAARPSPRPQLRSGPGPQPPLFFFSDKGLFYCIACILRSTTPTEINFISNLPRKMCSFIFWHPYSCLRLVSC
jgi:hypothetical protein